MQICVVGIGYIGLPTACILCDKGFQVVGFDINEKYINSLLNNNFKSNEKNLVEMVQIALKNKRLFLSTEPKKSDVYLICTPTPLDENNNPDLSYLINGLNRILPYLDKGNMIIVESTIPPKTTTEIIKPIIESVGLNVGEDIFLAHCPERVIPGNILFELVNNSRIIGGCTQKCAEIIQEFYQTFVQGEIYTTTAEVAEMVKLCENSYRDVNIALANEIAIICNELSIDPYSVIALANKHPRVNFLSPGIGVGGHCLPIDPYFIVRNAPKSSILIQAGRLINDNMPKYIVSKIENLLVSIPSPKIAVWGITYKGNSDDIRNSPSLEIIELLKNHYDVSIYDPLVDGINYDKIKYESVTNADLLMILANHNEFKEENYNLISSLMKTPVIFDGVNIVSKSKLSASVDLYNLANI